MYLRPEVLGLIGLCLGGLASLGLWLRMPQGSPGRPVVCPACGTIQHNLGRPAVLTHEVFGPRRCRACGHRLTPP